MIRSELTICAPASGPGGAISIIRISGKETFEIVSRIFFPADKAVNILTINGYRIIYGEIRSGDEVIDEVLVSIFRSPHSYTGENSAELSCHASPYIIMRILELLIENGASAARPGEFTQRAFLNGQMDLSQAEAVADVIASSSGMAHKIAINQLRGGFSGEISSLRAELLNFASLIELELDFGEEDVEFADRGELKAIIVRVKELTDRLSESFSLGNALKNGIPVVIVGKPNSGKSTLLNVLLQDDKAIVSDIPGTTRDTIEDTIVIDGIEYRFIDTAGLRETTDVIESLGIRKTFEKIAQASVILLVDEISDSPEQINNRIKAIREKTEGTDKKLIILINKSDDSDEKLQEQLASKIEKKPGENLLFISAKNKTGLEELREVLSDSVTGSGMSMENVMVTNIRHYEALRKVSVSLGRVLVGLNEGITEDLIATDIRQAIHYLGEITGEITTDEILGNIFKNFCIGK
jgi:tRNA modification GTPase